MTTVLIFLGLAFLLAVSVLLASEMNETRRLRERLRLQWRRRRGRAVEPVEVPSRISRCRPPPVRRGQRITVREGSGSDR